MQRHLLLIALALCAPAAPAAYVYKWTDASGVVHYADTEPAQDTKAERMHVAGMAKPAAAASDMAGVDASGSDKAAAAPAGTVVSAELNARTRCELARKNLEVLQGKSAVALDTGGAGAAAALDDSARQAQVARAQAAIAMYCK